MFTYDPEESTPMQMKAAAQLGFDPRRLQDLESYLQAHVDDGRFAGFHVQISRGGSVAFSAMGGHRDREAGAPIAKDTLYRIYSMTKPVTSVAAMMLYERAQLSLNDPVSKYIPSFENLRVYTGGQAVAPVTVPSSRPMLVKHLLTHTSGLTYGFQRQHVTDEIMRLRGHEFGPPAGASLAEACDAWASMPLRFEPGTSWNYGVSTDVLGRVVEVASGKSLDEFLRTEIFKPLGMNETGFSASDPSRLAALYLKSPGGISRFDAFGNAALQQPSMLSGGGGLVSSMRDYQRFVDMLAGGGELGNARILSPRTIAFMAQNHLPGDVDLAEFGIPLYAETPFDGVGFGLGFSVTIDPAATGIASSPGEYGWGGLASTYFWVDPVEDISCIFMTQLIPSNSYPVRMDLKQLVYSALID